MIARLFQMHLYRPKIIALLLKDAVGRRGPVLEARRHLEEAAQWLIRAQEATADDGVSGGYAFEDGWIASYPETTGYIIPTLLAYAERTGNWRYADRALVMAAWELTVQRPEGGFPGHFVDQANPPVVFNTGQVLFGLLAAHSASKEERFLESARRAACWLMRVQDQDGAWRRFEYRDTVHVYNTRTAWALIELGLATDDKGAVKAGRRNLDWALRQQEPNGWFRHCAFAPGEDPFLHTIAYTTQGLLESGLRLGAEGYVDAASRACRAVLDRMRGDGWIAGAFDPSWTPRASYSCLTGTAQVAAQWVRLYEVTKDEAFIEGAHRAIRFLKGLQDCRTSDLRVRGAIKGSHPIWGRYLFGTFPNWATKFFIDALLMEEAVAAGDSACIRCW